MSSSSLRKLAATGLGAALIGSGLTVGLGAGVASAVPDNCGTSVTKTTGTGAGASFSVTKEVVGDGTVAPGGTVTYRTTVSTETGTPTLVSVIGDFHPAGFTFEKALLTVKPLVGTPNETDQTSNVTKQPAKNYLQVKGGGWNVSGGNTASLETTYRVPGDAKVGDMLDSGMSIKPQLWDWQEWTTAGVCVTIRGKNPIEAAAGSLDGIGLGSVNTGSGNIFGSATDPAGSVGNIVDGINVGKIFGDLLKSGS